jgi:hypothetical protein
VYPLFVVCKRSMLLNSNGKLRRFIVDTVATVCFFTIVAAITELYVAGMEPQEVLKTRLIMIPMMAITGRPYGAWRDWFFNTTKPTVSWSKTIIDALAFMSFQLPIYALTLVIAGADYNEVIILLTSTAILMLIVSRPFGIYLETVRNWAGVSNP